jgi:nitroreductase/NAD-dependent dihydropyrimidine dehydrogenase PreA subunit
MLKFVVQPGLCTNCGSCIADCPSRIIETNGQKLPFILAENEGNCFRCQHCMAVCPTGAVSILGLDPANSLTVSADAWPRFEQMSHLVRGRRSVRQYLANNVEPALIDRLLAELAYAPTGVNSRALTLTVVDDKGQMDQLRKRVMGTLVEAQKAGRIPERASYLQRVITAYVQRGTDVIFRGAPHALIVSAPPETLCGNEDVTIALAYFELLAQSAGLGTVWWGFFKAICELLPEVKTFFRLPADHHYYAMLFGHPSIHFARTVQRENTAAIRRVKA